MKSFLLISFFFLISSIYSFCEEAKKLDNSGIYELAKALHGGVSKTEDLICQKVSIKASVSVRGDKTVFAKILNPDRTFEPTWTAHLMNFRSDFFASMTEGEEYEIEGCIVEDRMDYGAFWIYVNKYDKVEPAELGGG